MPTPDVGRETELSRKNLRTLKLYDEMQACGGSLQIDGVTRKNFGIIARLLRQHATAQRERLLTLLTAAITRR